MTVELPLTLEIMADQKITNECDYCGVEYTVKYDKEEGTHPEFCPFCGEITQESEVEEEDELDEEYEDYDEEDE